MQTLFFKNKPSILSSGTIAGSKESEGVVGKYVDKTLEDDRFGESTYEKAECKMLSFAVQKAMENGHVKEDEVDCLLAGDLLNQIISASFSARDFSFPYLGVYGACSTMAESLIVGSMLLDGGYFKQVVCATGSHFSSAERQYRYPLELGTTRPPQSQWTVTGAGATLLSSKKESSVCITSATLGRVVDFGVKDVNNMGAAMAPSACDTVLRHLFDTNTSPEDYDLIATGDLGILGSKIFKDLMKGKGMDVRKNHVDCGEIIYSVPEGDYQGGSGAGCSAVVFNSYLLEKLKTGKLKNVLFCATGALLSTVSSGQGESIPCVSHAVQIEGR